MTARPARSIEYVPLDDLVPATRNAKRHNTDALRQSIGRFGFASPALRDERTGRLVVGHGRTETLAAMRDAGQDAPDGVQVDRSGRWLVPVVSGWASRTDAEAEAYLLADNRLSEIGGWDNDSLAEMLGSLASTDYDLAEMAGWDAAALDDLIAASEEAAAPVVTHDAVPATAATYAETPEQEAARAANIGAYEPRVGASVGFTEMILVYNEEDRAEAVRLVAAARNVLGSEMRASEVMLRGLRALVAALDNVEDPEMARLAQAAGWMAA